MRELNTIAEFKIIGALTEARQTEKDVYQNFLLEFVLSGMLRRLAVSVSGTDCGYMQTHIGDNVMGALDIYSYKGKGNYEDRWFTNIRFKLSR